MKKFIKAMLILACVFGVVGIGFSLGGVDMGATMETVDIVQKMREKYYDLRNMDWEDDDWEDDDWEDDDWEDDDWEESHHTETGSTDSNGKRVHTTAPANEVEINLRYDELILEAYDGDTMRIEIENDKTGNVRVKYEKGELKINSSSKVSHRSVTVFYPKDAQFDKMEINVHAGNVELLSDLSVQELDVNVGAGTLENDASLTVQKAGIEVGTGTVDLQGLTAGEIDGECGLGSMSLELAGRGSNYNYKLECGLGVITIDGEDFTSLAKEKKINNPGASGTIELECGMGSISVDFEDAE